MRELDLAARRKPKRRSATRPGKGRWRATDLVKRDFLAQKINTKWYGDGTEIKTGQGKLPGLGPGHGLAAGARLRARRAP
jgi:putative transposase